MQSEAPNEPKLMLIEQQQNSPICVFAELNISGAWCQVSGADTGSCEPTFVKVTTRHPTLTWCETLTSEKGKNRV